MANTLDTVLDEIARYTDIVIEVTDNGKGFPAEGRQRLLEPYMTTREGGTGLGLAIVKHIVERHRGRLEIRSRIGEGTAVRVYLPRSTAADVTKLS